MSDKYKELRRAVENNERVVARCQPSISDETIYTLLAERDALLEALELVIDTHKNGGWPSATMVVARAAIEAAKLQEGV